MLKTDWKMKKILREIYKSEKVGTVEIMCNENSSLKKAIKVIVSKLMKFS